VPGGNYFILLILTDGIITDMQQTCDAIVNVSAASTTATTTLYYTFGVRGCQLSATGPFQSLQTVFGTVCRSTSRLHRLFPSFEAV